MIYLCVNWVALDFFILIFSSKLAKLSGRGTESSKDVVSGTVWSQGTPPGTSCFEMNSSAFVINISW